MAECSFRRARKKLIQAARWLVCGAEQSAPDSSEIAAFGLVWQEEEQSALTVWPDNCESVMVCDHMLTQMHHGMDGPTGFRYESLPVVLWGLGIKRKRRREIYHDLRVMERTILECIRNDK